MDDPNTHTNASGTLEADEEILTYTPSDEALEAAAGAEAGMMSTAVADWCSCAQWCVT
jgi:hypothetical protein